MLSTTAERLLIATVCVRACFADAATHPRSLPGLSGKLLVLQPFWFQCIRAKTPFLVFFVILKVAFKPFHMGVALKGQNVGTYPVEEKTVVRDDHGAASEINKSVFQRAGFRRPDRWWVHQAAGRYRLLSTGAPCGHGCVRRLRVARLFSVDRRL